MQQRTVEQVESWPSRRFSGGYDGLHDLASSGFSGAIDAGPWLFMLNGRLVGVFDGDLDEVEDASGTAYTSPDPSLPLLFTMLERGGEQRAEYYTGNVPLEEVDETLSDGRFTGYVELSENVLSGDYYVVYYGGNAMSCAFVGNARRLKTGDEAFDLAADEVGIYTVNRVDVDVIDIPGDAPDATDADDAGAGTGTAGAAGAATAGAAPDDVVVVGNTVDTVRVGRDRFLGGSWFRAVLSPVGRRRDYSLPRELLPEDASLILIDVSEHLP